MSKENRKCSPCSLYQISIELLIFVFLITEIVTNAIAVAIAVAVLSITPVFVTYIVEHKGEILNLVTLFDFRHLGEVATVDMVAANHINQEVGNTIYDNRVGDYRQRHCIEEDVVVLSAEGVDKFLKALR